MSLIHSVSSETKSLAERLAPDLGVRGYRVVLNDGRELFGVLESVGSDHLVLLGSEEAEFILPLSAILYLTPKRD